MLGDWHSKAIMLDHRSTFKKPNKSTQENAAVSRHVHDHSENLQLLQYNKTLDFFVQIEVLRSKETW